MAHLFTSERLHYRALQPEDSQPGGVLHRYCSDPLATSLSSLSLHTPAKPASIDDLAKSYREHTLLTAVMVVPDDTKDGQAVGIVALVGGPGDRAHHRAAVMSIFVLDGWQGRGYGPEAIRWVCGWGFRFANLHRIACSTFGWNERGLKLYPRLGFALEGRRREQIWYDGAWHDMVDFGLLADEYAKLGRGEGAAA